MKSYQILGVGLIVIIVIKILFDSIFATPQTDREYIRSESDWVAYLEDHSGEEAYAYFKQLHAGKSFAAHTAAHEFDKALYTVHGTAGITVCDAEFKGGCMHGLAGQMLLLDGVEKWPEFIKICSEAEGENIIDCRHSVGHGFMILKDYSHEAMLQALQRCREAFYLKDQSAGEDEHRECYHGVFMEYNQQNVGHENITTYRELDLTQPYYPCDVLDEEYKKACYHRLTRLWVLAQPHEEDHVLFRILGRWCREMVDSVYENTCDSGISTTITSYAEIREQSKAEAMCREAFTDTQKQLQCFALVERGLVTN